MRKVGYPTPSFSESAHVCSITLPELNPKHFQCKSECSRSCTIYMFPLPVHKPAWWAGPFSLTLFTNMVSIGSSRPFWYPVWQKTKKKKMPRSEDCVCWIVKMQNSCKLFRNKPLGCSWYLKMSPFHLTLLSTCGYDFPGLREYITT